MGVSLTLFALLAAGPADAQDTDDDVVPETPAEATPTATPTTAPTATPIPAPSPTATASPTASPSPAPTPSAVAAPSTPRIDRTPPRNTSKLVELLQPLAEWGIPLEDIHVQGMGRFPVGGPSYYSDDWLAARYKPSFHLHRGLDIFAAFGTPIRAPTAGVVTAFSSRYPGGIAVTMRGHDSTTYYFAHLMAGAADLRVGQSVEVGTVIGYVGNTGNAAGGPPHLHLEIRQEGTTVPPKPLVDQWLDEAEAGAGDWVELRRFEIEVDRRAAPDGHGDVSTALLELALDPARASLTLLPRIEVHEDGLRVRPPVQMPAGYYS